MKPIKTDKDLKLPYPPTAQAVDTSERPNFGKEIKIIAKLEKGV